jgi:Relaxase/Mobilisation nuclease domain
MPIIINGGSRSAGGWWAKHLQNGEKNERVQVIEVVGLSAATIPDAFREMEGISLGSKCKNYFYQANINPRADERLTPAQWREAVDTLEKNLGLTGQPRFVVEHEKEGRTHRHVVWSRIDPERMTAISDSLTAAIHERTSRDLEIKFDLERGQSILVPDRKIDRPDRRPKKHETFRSMDSGIDPETVKADARRHWHSADNGQSFKAALEASGDYVLARGDRRDFVIVDRAGDDHSLARRLGVKAAEMRARMADIDPACLPNVQEAKAQQQMRQAERHPSQQPNPAAEIATAAERAMQEAREAAKGRYDRLRETERDVAHDQFPGRYDELRAAAPPPEVVREFESNANRAAESAAPVYDRDFDNALWEEKLAEAAIAAQEARQQPGASAGRETRAGGPEPSGGQGNRPEAQDTRPLGKTAGEIHVAWTLSRSAAELEAALAAKGISLAAVSAGEARQSERTAAFAKAIGNFEPVLKENEIVAVNEYGDVFRLDRRTTGEAHPDIAARFPQIDRAALLNVTATTEVMQEAARAARRDERQVEQDMARPLTGIETTIADALTSTMTGTEFAAAIDRAGFTITRATEADKLALDALRQNENMARLAAETNREAREPHFFAKLEPGDFAVVTRAGDVFRLNPTALDFGEVEQRLADVQPRMPSVVEARAVNEINREQTAELWAQRRADNTAAREARADAIEAQHEMRDTVQAGRDALGTVGATFGPFGRGIKAAGKAANIAAKAIESAVSGIFSFFGGAEPKLTRQQTRDRAKAETNEETLHAHAYDVAMQRKEAEADERIFNQDRQQQQEDMSLSARFGTPPTREANRGREHDDDRGRERER